MISVKQAVANRQLDLGLTQREAESYSIARAILAACDPKENSFEREVSETIAAKLGRPVRGPNAIFAPTALRPRMSGLDDKTNAGGAYTLFTKVPDLVEALRTQLRLTKLGVTYLPGLDYSLQFATEASATAAYWVTENSTTDVGEQDMVFSAALAGPHTLQGTLTASRQFLSQAARNVNLEARIRRDLMKSHAIAVEIAALNGSGSSGQPVGLLQTTGLNVVSIGQNGGPATYATICSLEEAVGLANADPTGFITTPTQRRKLREVAINGVGSDMTWDAETNTMLGLPSFSSTAVPSTLSKGSSNGNLHAIICGAWNEMIICEFGAIELVVDQFGHLKKQGVIELTSFSMCDVVIPKIGAFSAIVDAA
jgi:HK97 family phage major capsid protein